jgi:acyl-CoA thioesterase
MSEPSDVEWLGLERRAKGEWSFELTGPLSRFDGKFFGGAGIAVMTALMEAETSRLPLWASVQFVGSADVGDRIDCRVDVVAGGRRTAQVRMTARVGDRVMLEGIGSAGDDRPDSVSAQFGGMPDVDPPETAADWRPNVPFKIDFDAASWLQVADIREAMGAPGHAIWARMRHRRQSFASLGFLADMVPSAVVRAAGRAGAGTSLDNSMRFGPRPDTEWILVDFDPYFAAGGYAHGGARLWATDGTLLGVASQTATMVLFD